MFDTDNAGAVPAPERRQRKAATKTKKKPAKKDTRIKAPKKPKKKAKAPAAARADLRPGTKLALIDRLLRQPGGCTRADVMKACDWPSVSMPQQAAALGAELKSEKKSGEPTRYWID